ncbi:MAG TPA: SPFH domain-containing protein [Candidatus Baltobacteraceae bacterium]|jgi:regulator of protease activity HflC (stomatin/prohibitin superfamily)
MAEIRQFPIWRHARVDASAYAIHYRNARILKSGRGLSFWFRPLSDSIAEVPMDDRELTLVVHGRSADFQDVTAQGILSYRTQDANVLADHVDFTIDSSGGNYVREPIESLELMLSQLAQEFANSYVARTQLRELLINGLEHLRQAIEAGLNDNALLTSIGIAVASVRISSIRPSADLEKAIEAPVREEIKQKADEATFARRAFAVEKERAIAENELQNRIALATREEELLQQQGQNARRKALDEASTEKITAESLATTRIIESDAEAQTVRTVEAARNEVERERLAAYNEMDPRIILGLAAREFAGKLRTIEHLNVAPDLLSPMLATLFSAGTKRLQES